MIETTPDLLPLETVVHIRDTCLCLAAQRAARSLARRFDTALRPFGLTNGQFSLMVALNQPEPPPMGRLAPFLAMDASTLTAAVKPLARRGLLTVEPDPDDRRSRRLRITPEGVSLMREAAEVWRAAHADLEATLATDQAASLRSSLAAVASAATSAQATKPYTRGSRKLPQRPEPLSSRTRKSASDAGNR